MAVFGGYFERKDVFTVEAFEAVEDYFFVELFEAFVGLVQLFEAFVGQRLVVIVVVLG